jgi:SAM-dependent methyltransferase
LDEAMLLKQGDEIDSLNEKISGIKILKGVELNILKDGGVDISEKCVEVARRENPGMRFQVMDIADLDLADESVDGIISFYSAWVTLFQRFKHCI